MRPQIYIDRRLGGIPRYRLYDPEAAEMIVPDEIRKCVAFLQYQPGSGHKTAGTVFFVGVEEEGVRFDYAVTANHVVEKIKKDGVDGMTYFRLNKRDGGFDRLAMPTRKWLRHPTDSTTDLTLMEFPRNTPFDVMVIPLPKMAATDDVINLTGMGIGDELFTVGLFHLHSGTTRNIPIVRFGNIAAMPEEPVTINTGQKMDAYLVELRSIGGLSGSPVFTWLLPYGPKASQRHGEIYLLGIMHGHWDVEGTSIDKIIEDKTGDEPLNTGIGLVIPVSKLLEAINQDRLADMRRETIREVQAGRAPTPDVGLALPS